MERDLERAAWSWNAASLDVYRLLLVELVGDVVEVAR